MVCVDHHLILDVTDGKMFVWEVHHGMLCYVECSSRVSAVSGVNVTPIVYHCGVLLQTSRCYCSTDEL